MHERAIAASVPMHLYMHKRVWTYMHAELASTTTSLTQLQADKNSAQARVAELESQVEAMIEQLGSAGSSHIDVASTSQLEVDR